MLDRFFAFFQNSAFGGYAVFFTEPFNYAYVTYAYAAQLCGLRPPVAALWLPY